MYRDEVAAISSSMMDDRAAFVRGIRFSCFSARQPIETVPEALADAEANGTSAEALNVLNRLACYEYTQEHGDRLWMLLRDERDIARGIRTLLDVPGLGIIKAAFVMQFLGHNVGCIDTHNMRWDKVPARAFCARGTKKGQPARYTDGQIARYLGLAEGRAEFLWDRWCTRVAKMRPDIFPDAEYVSRLHLAIC